MATQMTLGQLIDVLRRKPPEMPVSFDFVHFKPKGLHSYRGDYSELAIGYGHDDVTVLTLRANCEAAVGETFTGWKGGDYEMDRETPLWAANPDEAGRTAIVDAREIDGGLVLVTEKRSLWS